MTPSTNIHEYLAELDDIPGTRVYTAARARCRMSKGIPIWHGISPRA